MIREPHLVAVGCNYSSRLLWLNDSDERNIKFFPDSQHYTYKIRGETKHRTFSVEQGTAIIIGVEVDGPAAALAALEHRLGEVEVAILVQNQC